MSNLQFVIWVMCFWLARLTKNTCDRGHSGQFCTTTFFHYYRLFCTRDSRRSILNLIIRLDEGLEGRIEKSEKLILNLKCNLCKKIVKINIYFWKICVVVGSHWMCQISVFQPFLVSFEKDKAFFKLFYVVNFFWNNGETQEAIL